MFVLWIWVIIRHYDCTTPVESFSQAKFASSDTLASLSNSAFAFEQRWLDLLWSYVLGDKRQRAQQERDSGEGRKSHSPHCQPAETNAAVLETTAALLPRRWRARLLPGLPTAATSRNSACKESCRPVRRARGPCPTVIQPQLRSYSSTPLQTALLLEVHHLPEKVMPEP